MFMWAGLGWAEALALELCLGLPPGAQGLGTWRWVLDEKRGSWDASWRPSSTAGRPPRRLRPRPPLQHCRLAFILLRCLPGFLLEL